MINSSIHKTLIDSILQDERTFNNFFDKTGLSYKDIKGKEISQITQMCKNIFTNPNESALKIDILDDNETMKILESIDKIDALNNDETIQGGGGHFLGNISSCHVNITDEERVKMSSYMDYIEKIIDDIDTRDEKKHKSVRIPISIGTKNYVIVFCYRKGEKRKSIISFYVNSFKFFFR